VTLKPRPSPALAVVMAAATAAALATAAAPAAATTASCAGQQLIGNSGFETGSPTPWSTTGSVVSGTAHSGSHSIVLGGWVNSTQTLALTLTIPTGCTSAVLSYWLHIVTEETTTTTAYDTLKVQVVHSGIATTLATYSNLNASAGWVQHSLGLAGFAGQTVTLRFVATNDATLPTWFYLDDITLTVS
jgi:hypothetical protein